MGVISSGVLAGVAKVALVVVSIGGLSVGAYFAYQIGPGGSDGTSVQLEPTLQIQPTLAAPSPTAGRVTPTATVEPTTPQPTLAGVDTSTWLTYESPLGVSIKYPVGWTITFDTLTDERSAIGTHAVIRNGVTDDTGEDWGTPGVMLVTVRRHPGPYNAALFKDTCEPEGGDVSPDRFDGPADVPSGLTAAGRPAVLCERSDITPAGLDIFNFILYIDMPDDRVIEIVSTSTAPKGNELAVVKAVAESFSLTVQ